jgi:threonine/homoserine/homoserine lactone efflux protein
MLDALLKGFLLGLLLTIGVGPVIFSIIKQSINNGPRGGFAFVAGVSASDIALVLISNVFTELFRSISSLQFEIGVAGSIFLIIMGIYFLFFKKVPVNDQGQHLLVQIRGMEYARIALSGFLMNVLNPAIFLFWITASSTFISYSVTHRVVIFSTGLLVLLAGDTAKVLLAGKIRNRLTPHNIQILNRINGMILIGFGIAMVWWLIRQFG